MEMVQLDYHVTPFRAQRFAELYWPAVARARSPQGRAPRRISNAIPTSPSATPRRER